MRFIALIFILATCALLQAQAVTDETVPILPANTVLQHWDHHWFVWLPKHPLYESAEVMSTDPPDRQQPLVWLFFTERPGPKKQVHYFNDKTAAAALPGSYYREIEYEKTGGGAQSVRVSMTDKDGKRVGFEVKVDSAEPLIKAGLTNQSGHSAANIFLLFYRGEHAMANSNRVTIGSEDFSFNSMDGVEGAYPFMAAYSRNIYVAAFPYGTAHVGVKAGVLLHSWGRLLTKHQEGGKIFFQSAPTPRGEFLKLESDGPEGLINYVHQVGQHQMIIHFDPPLVAPAAGKIREIKYSISLDGFRDLVNGTMSLSNTNGIILLKWNHEKPEWARAYAFISTLTPDADRHGYTLSVSRLSSINDQR